MCLHFCLKACSLFMYMLHCVAEYFMNNSLNWPGNNEIPWAERRLPVKQQMWLDSLSLPYAGRSMTDRRCGLQCEAGDGWAPGRRGEAVTWADIWSCSLVISKQQSDRWDIPNVNSTSHSKCDDDDETLYFYHSFFHLKASRRIWHLKDILGPFR